MKTYPWFCAGRALPRICIEHSRDREKHLRCTCIGLDLQAKGLGMFKHEQIKFPGLLDTFLVLSFDAT